MKKLDESRKDGLNLITLSKIGDNDPKGGHKDMPDTKVSYFIEQTNERLKMIEEKLDEMAIKHSESQGSMIGIASALSFVITAALNIALIWATHKG
jgi:hypothetical protein